MNDPEKILHGFLELSVSGDQLERFLNLCHARAVSLERIRYPYSKKKRFAVFAAQNPKT